MIDLLNFNNKIEERAIKLMNIWNKLIKLLYGKEASLLKFVWVLV